MNDVDVGAVADECRDGGGGQHGFGDCLHGYVFLIAGSVAFIVVIVTSVTSAVVCWRQLHKR